MRGLSEALVVGLLVSAAACAGGNDVTCGADTHLSGSVCVGDSREASSVTDAAPPRIDARSSSAARDATGDDPRARDAGKEDAGHPDVSVTPPEAGRAATEAGQGDAGVVRDGDPCPGGDRSVCSGNHVFACQLANNGSFPVGTLSDVANCDLLTGTCTLDEGGNGSCTGGGYTTCVGQARACYSATVLETCEGVWSPTDCGTMVCRLTDAGQAVCAP